MGREDCQNEAVWTVVQAAWKRLEDAKLDGLVMVDAAAPRGRPRRAIPLVGVALRLEAADLALIDAAAAKAGKSRHAWMQAALLRAAQA
jgi:hypothetical protein